jgi:hypothetical protein
MIYEALSCLVDEMNEHFRSRLKLNEQKVILSSIVNQDGTIAIQGENKIVITLINIEKESAMSVSQKGAASLSNSVQPLNLNLFVLFSAYFSQGNYPESLRFLSFVIGYFVNKPVFNHSNTPDLESKIDKLTFEIVDLNPDTVSNLWSGLGAKYMPSVVYKVRMITFDETFVREFRPSISSVSDEQLLKEDDGRMLRQKDDKVVGENDEKLFRE